MCGRFSLKSTIQAIEDELSIESTGIIVSPRYNIAPTQDVLILYKNKQLVYFRWGLIPFWVKNLNVGNRIINARAETLTQKMPFKTLFKNKRCLIIADGFFEWQQGTKVPYYFSLKNGKPFTFGGLWNEWDSPDGEKIFSCTIITTQPNNMVNQYHDRMPTIISSEYRNMWIDETYYIESNLCQILRPYPENEMTVYKVSKHVNSPKNDDPKCIEKL